VDTPKRMLMAPATHLLGHAFGHCMSHCRCKHRQQPSARHEFNAGTDDHTWPLVTSRWWRFGPSLHCLAARHLLLCQLACKLFRSSAGKSTSHATHWVANIVCPICQSSCLLPGELLAAASITAAPMCSWQSPCPIRTCHLYSAPVEACLPSVLESCRDLSYS